MPLAQKSRAIVLHTTRQGDNALVITVLDSTMGRCGIYLRGVGKSRGGTAPFHSLAVLDVVTATSPYSSLATLREYEPVFPLVSLRSDMGRSSIALFICEILYRTLRGGDGDASLFEFVTESAVRLDAVDGSTANFHLWWLAAFCCRMGFRPENNRSEDAPLFDIATARFVPQGGLYVEGALFSHEDSALLATLLGSTLDEALSIPLSSGRRQTFARRMLDYLSYHLGQTLDVRSLEVLHAVFA